MIFFVYLFSWGFSFAKHWGRTITAHLSGEPIKMGQVVARNKLGKSCDRFYQHVEELYFNYFFVFNTKELVLGIKFGRGKKQYANAIHGQMIQSQKKLQI